MRSRLDFRSRLRLDCAVASACPMNGEPVLLVRGLTKRFPGVLALHDVHLDVRAGRVHAVLGENGAGKSTLMRILAGLESADNGEIWYCSRIVQLRTPHQALQLGIAMIHQELMPFPDLTVAENIFMGPGLAPGFPGWIDRSRLNIAATAALERVGARLRPARLMRELSVAEAQTVEIARAVVHDARVFIMDEPTSALSDREVAALFAVIRDLRQRGAAVLYVSHRLEEIHEIADAVTVLRDGRWIATGPIDELKADQLIALMVGRELAAGASTRSSRPGKVALAVRGLGRDGCFMDVSFELRRGEVLGLAGLLGAGRTALVHALCGLVPADVGEIRVNGRVVNIRNPRDAMGCGLSAVTEDRKRSGLVDLMSVKHNLTLANLRRCCRGPWIDATRERHLAGEQVRQFGIKAADVDQPVRNLSGGNQQKVVLAKALSTDPAVLILDEPTRGIDVGAKAEVHTLIAQLAADGRAILMVSSELPEVLALSDRLLVMREGCLSAELDPKRTTPAEVMRFAMPQG